MDSARQNHKATKIHSQSCRALVVCKTRKIGAVVRVYVCTQEVFPVLDLVHCRECKYPKHSLIPRGESPAYTLVHLVGYARIRTAREVSSVALIASFVPGKHVHVCSSNTTASTVPPPEAKFHRQGSDCSIFCGFSSGRSQFFLWSKLLLVTLRGATKNERPENKTQTQQPRERECLKQPDLRETLQIVLSSCDCFENL